MQMVARNRTVRAVSGLRHFGTICADRHFSANGMPHRARVVSFRVRAKWVGTARTRPQVPFVMPQEARVLSVPGLVT
jgi:hypothetical protein